MTKYTKTPPTEPGDYWFKQAIDGKVFAMNIFTFRGQLRCSWGTNPQMSIESLVLDGCVEVGPRIEPPREVPQDVTKAISFIRVSLSDRLWRKEDDDAMRIILDYIDSLSPSPELPLPEWKRGAWNGVPCTACKIFHPGFQESRWYILTGEMMIERNLAEVAHGNLRLDGATP